MSSRDARMITHRVLLAAGNFGETCQVRKHRPGAILAKDMQQGPLCWELVRGEVARDHCEALAQFRSVAPVASIAKRTEPLERVRLTDDGAGAYYLPTLAPGVAGSTDVIQSARGRGQLFGLRQSALAGRLPRAVDVKDHPGTPCAPGLLVGRERATRQIVEKERAQGIDRRLGKRCQKA